MTLGQRIYNLRTEKNLSQTDLAERLDVSRQSVSKWETDASVPDLDKLVKLCDLFEVSMDELVRGAEPKEKEAPEPQVIVREVKVGTPTRVIVGAALLVIGALTAVILSLFAEILEALLLGFPFVLCGVICLTVKKRSGLWCVWLLVVLSWLYGQFVVGTGLVAAAVLIIAIIATAIVLRRETKINETTL